MEHGAIIEEGILQECSDYFWPMAESGTEKDYDIDYDFEKENK